MNDWHEEIKEFLDSGNYPVVINYYEKRIAENPEEITDYWYLGLAYLLNGNEEEATAIWLVPFVELLPEETDNLNQNLQEILLREAKRHAAKNNHNTEGIIREKIVEIAPDNLENMIKLALCNCRRNCFDPEILKLLSSLLERGRELTEEEIKDLYLLLEFVLEIPDDATIKFLEKIIPILGNDNKFVQVISAKIDEIADRKQQPFWGAKLLAAVVDTLPNKLQNIGRLFQYYSRASRDEEAKIYAQEYEKYSETLPQKVSAYYQLLINCISRDDWFNVPQYEQKLREYLEKLIANPPEEMEEYLAVGLIVIPPVFFYLRDNLIENRHVVNSIGRIFHQQIHRIFPCIGSSFSNRKNQQPRKLKIGYIGCSLRRHPVGLLSRWLIKYHNREEFSIHTYGICQPQDYITKKFFQQGVDKSYISSSGNVKEIVNQIQKDEIDILVDLDSATNNTTAAIMALKPAPIQVTWLGLDSDGIPDMDYFIADPYVLPPEAEQYYTEKIWRLPHVYVAVEGFEVDVPTLRREDLEIEEKAVVYFHIQNPYKRNPHTIRLQMKILKAVPNSYLLVKGMAGKSTENLFKTIATEEGVNPNRLRFLPPAPTEAIHRANLKIADVVLDTYPYNGATTTLETLWQEIPIVTRVGEQFAARNSYSFMMNVGLREGIAFTDEEYVEWGIRLGTDEDLRLKVTWKLKRAKHASPLWDALSFARDMENAYRQMYEAYQK
ncbi:MAG TPA: O-linked N-acetylglucosamine transferase, SPINDLY family protein [Geminocystis sp. M7585_C2015_104]|nr:O-linked N-acetylglucosamine transferase, SPINDLY family protein [Geminocystis sp. M7585_C2015_104]